MINGYCVHCMEAVSAEDARCGHCGNTAEYESRTHHLKPGSLLQGRYLIGRVLGEGGFGITYVGRDKLLDMRVAVKEFYPNGMSHRNHYESNTVTLSHGNSGADFERNMQRFLQEARLLAKFSSEPGIVGVRDFFRENGTAYIIMEYLDGITLKTYVQEYGPVPPEQLFAMLDPVLLSLARVHEQGLIHRDISPDNIIMLRETGNLKLLDFGAARDVSEERSLSVVLKWGYAPEEQYRTKGLQGSWTDVYAICATMYKCMTGVTPMESLDRIFGDTLKPPSELGVDIDQRQEQALMHGLGVKKEDRTQDIYALREELFGIPVEEQRPRITVGQEHSRSGGPHTFSGKPATFSFPHSRGISVSGSRLSGTPVPEEENETVYSREDIRSVSRASHEDAPTEYIPLQSQQAQLLQQEAEAPADPEEKEMPEPGIPEETPDVQVSDVPDPEDETIIGNIFEEEQPENTGSEEKQGGSRRWVKPACFAAGAAAVLIGAALLFGSRKPPETGLPMAKVPAQRVMAADCSGILRRENASGSVLELKVREQSVYEQYQTAIVLCDVTVLEKGAEKQYTVKLHYDYEANGWMLNGLSRIEG